MLGSHQWNQDWWELLPIKEVAGPRYQKLAVQIQLNRKPRFSKAFCV